jgi:hypothetical protein
MNLIRGGFVHEDFPAFSGRAPSHHASLRSIFHRRDSQSHLSSASTSASALCDIHGAMIRRPSSWE